MAFISYAQNLEDLVLWRALQQVKQGFYVDVGAAWATEDSVTKSFYQRGWRGVNIEPNPEFMKDYAETRQGDITLNIALGKSTGYAEMSFFSDTGLSSLIAGVSNEHVKTGRPAEVATVEIDTLTNVFSQHKPKGDIHFLKVDVEGFEQQVLEGNDWKKYRPWIVVVEATHPMSQVENHHDWEHLLLDADYSLAYTDGLNRFYLSSEHMDLMPSFKYPPNIFDNYKSAYIDNLERALSNLEQALSNSEHALSNSEQALSNSEQALSNSEQLISERNFQITELQLQSKNLEVELHTSKDESNAYINALLSSRSWKITKPIRLIGEVSKRAKSGIKKNAQLAKHKIRLTAKRAFTFSLFYIQGKPRLTLFAVETLSKLPRLDSRVRRMVKLVRNQPQPRPTLDIGLSDRGNIIYKDLKSQFKQGK